MNYKTIDRLVIAAFVAGVIICITQLSFGPDPVEGATASLRAAAGSPTQLATTPAPTIAKPITMTPS